MLMRYDRAGVCAIIKGLYIIQLQQQDFSYNGKNLTIWTAVETATAIIAASIPVLRVFFKEAVHSYSRSYTRTDKSMPLSRLNRSQTTTTIQAGGDKGLGWLPLGDGHGDGSSQRDILGDEETGKGGAIVTHGDEGIKRTNTVAVTVAVESDGRSDYKARSFLGIE
jgi:hypothetical protein